MAASRRLSIEREKSAEKLLYQPGSYPNCETNNNPQIYENIDSYIAGEACFKTNGEIQCFYEKPEIYWRMFLLTIMGVYFFKNPSFS